MSLFVRYVPWGIGGGFDGGVTTMGAFDGQAGAAEGASIVGTTLYMQSATALVPGSVNISSQTFTGAKTFDTSLLSPIFSTSAALPATAGTVRLSNAQAINWRNFANSGNLGLSLDVSNIFQLGAALTIAGNITASNFSGSSSGTNTGDVTLTAIGSSPANAGASLSGQVLTLQPADATHGGVVSTTTQAFGGAKQFASGVGIGAAVSGGSGFDLEITQGAGGAQAVASGYSNAVGGNFIGRQANGTSTVPTASQTDDALATLSGRGYGATAFASGRRGAFRVLAAQNWTDTNQGTYLTLQVTPNNSTTIATALTIGNDSAAVFAGTVAASNLSGTNTGDVTLAAFGSTPSANAASLSGQVLTLQPADATHPGGVSTTTQTFAGDKTISGATTPLSVEIAGNSATVVAQLKSSGNFATQINLDSNRSANGNTLALVRALWDGTVVASISFLAGVTAAGAKDDGLIAFFTKDTGGANTQRMTISSAGLVGVNMTPARQLDVTGTFGATGAAALGSTLGVAGDFAVATNKFTVASATGNTLVAGTLTVTGLVAPSAGIRGVAAATDATAGNIGQYIESVVAATNYPTSTQYGDITSISLTAGDWDVTASAESTLNAAVATVATELGISTTSGNSATGLVAGSNWIHTAVPTATRPQGHSIPSYRMSLGGTTTVYMKALATYTGGPPQLAGRLSARRVQPG